MKTINITINGKTCTANEGDTVLKIAADNGIEIPNMCFDSRMEAYGGCGLCLIEADGIGKLLRACSTIASDNMVIHTDSERVFKARKIALELLMSDHEGDCLGPCTLHCPAGTDCQGYVGSIAGGDYTDAVRIIKEKVPLPASIGRICPHPCETACRRQLVEEPISIACLKSFAADKLHAKGERYLPAKEASTGKTVAVVGGGPGGLTAAYFLALKGHAVTVFDAMPKMGGMLRYGIPEYRLPKAVLQREVDEIASLGVVMKNNVRIGKDIAFDEIQKTYNAVLVAIGAWNSSKLRCPGEELENVWGGIDFLREVALGNSVYVGNKTAVVGGGNTAMDACRTAVRLGAKEVSIIYRRTRDEMPAEDIEIEEAAEEGVVFRFLRNPDVILGENGKVTGVKLQVMELGEPDAKGRRSPVPVEGSFETIELDSIIIATGQKNNNAGFETVETNRWGCLAADEKSFRTNLPGVFAVGDATNNGASIAIEAIGEAEKASKVIDAYLNGLEVSYHKPFVSERKVTAEDFEDRERMPRVRMNVRPASERRNDFKEIIRGFSDKQAQDEASRCLKCGCHDYHDCKLIRYARENGVTDISRFCGEKHKPYQETKLICIERDQGKCVLCGLCVRSCEQIAKKGILGFVGRAFPTQIKPEFDNEKAIAGCADCRLCAEICPTGALKLLISEK